MSPRWLFWLIELMRRTLLYTTIVRQEAYVERIGNLIMEQNKNDRVVQFFAPVARPGPGYHILWVDGLPVLALFYYSASSPNCTYPNYELTSLQSLHKLPRILFGNDILEIVFEPVSNDWMLQFPLIRSRARPLDTDSGETYVWKKETIEEIIQLYKDSPNRHVSILVYGKSGVGKTRLGLDIAWELQRRDECTPTLVTGFNPMISGMRFSLLEGHVASGPMAPDVITIDEYDKIVEHACKPEAERRGTPGQMCYANDKTTLAQCRDTLDIRDNSIIIYTMNGDPHKYDGDPDAGAFFRKETVQLVIHATVDEIDEDDKKKKRKRKKNKSN
jgi:hypothetical protein